MCKVGWKKRHIGFQLHNLFTLIIIISELNRCGRVSAKSGLACPSMETYMKLHVSKNHNSLGLDVIP